MFQLSLSTSLTPPTVPDAGLFPALSGAFSAVLAGVTEDASAPIEPGVPSPALRQPDAAAGKSLPIAANAGLPANDSDPIVLLASAAAPAGGSLLAVLAAPMPAAVPASPMMTMAIDAPANAPIAAVSPTQPAVGEAGPATASDEEPVFPAATVTVALPTHGAAAIPARSTKPKSSNSKDEGDKRGMSPPNLSAAAAAPIVLPAAPIDQPPASVSLPVGATPPRQGMSGSSSPAPIAAAAQTGSAAVEVASPRVGGPVAPPAPSSVATDGRSPAPTGHMPDPTKPAAASTFPAATPDKTVVATGQSRGIPTAATSLNPGSLLASPPLPIVGAKPARFEIGAAIGTSAATPAPVSNPPSIAPVAGNPAPAIGPAPVPSPAPATATDTTALSPLGAGAAPQPRSPGLVATRPNAPDTSPHPTVPDVRPQPAASIVSPSPATQAAGVLFGIAIGGRTLADDRRSPRDEALQALAAVAAAASPTAPVAAASGAQQGALDMHRADWPQAMIDHIEALRDAADATSTRITLMPDALGKVDVSLRHDGDTVHVHFAADTAQARTMLADAQPRLADAAQARGIRLGQTSVGAGGGESGRQPPRQPAAPMPSRPVSVAVSAPDAASDSSRLA